MARDVVAQTLAPRVVKIHAVARRREVPQVDLRHERDDRRRRALRSGAPPSRPSNRPTKRPFLYGLQSSARAASHHARRRVRRSSDLNSTRFRRVEGMRTFRRPIARKTPRHSARIRPCQPSDEKATTRVSSEAAGATSGARPSAACQTRPIAAAARGPPRRRSGVPGAILESPGP